MLPTPLVTRITIAAGGLVATSLVAAGLSGLIPSALPRVVNNSAQTPIASRAATPGAAPVADAASQAGEAAPYDEAGYPQIPDIEENYDDANAYANAPDDDARYDRARGEQAEEKQPAARPAGISPAPYGPCNAASHGGLSPRSAAFRSLAEAAGGTSRIAAYCAPALEAKAAKRGGNAAAGGPGKGHPDQGRAAAAKP
jgi:hypothetical protein